MGTLTFLALGPGMLIEAQHFWTECVVHLETSHTIDLKMVLCN